MTIREYLYRLEYLYYRRESKFDKYMKLSARASDPKSSLDINDVPIIQSGSNSRENLLIESSMALEEYYKADDEYQAYNKEYTDSLNQLSLAERFLLDKIYIDNRGRPKGERYKGICLKMGVKKNEIPALEKAAEQHLKQILLEKGVEIE